MEAEGKAKLFDQVAAFLGVDETDAEKIPELVARITRIAKAEECLVSFSFNTETRQLRQVAVSKVPPVPEAYQIISEVTLQLAQQFNAVAVEVSKAMVAETQERAEG